MNDLIKPEIVLPDVEINLVRAKEPVDVPIIESRICTAAASPNFIRHIVFDVSGTPLEGNIVSGQAVGVIAEGLDADGKPHKVRLYSVASPSKGEDGQGKIYSTTVKRVIDENWDTQHLFTGVCSNFLCDQKPGSILKMTGPSGKRFILPQHPGEYNYLFFATGTGIAPFRGMIMDLVEAKTKNFFTLIFGCPYRTDLIYPEYFESLDKTTPNFHYLKSISREEPRPDGSKYYVQYQLTDNRALLEPELKKDNTLIYICGLKGMETGIYKILAELGYMDYLKVPEPLQHTDPKLWSRDDLKLVKPSERMFVEVY